jgi:hypothetical protein
MLNKGKKIRKKKTYFFCMTTSVMIGHMGNNGIFCMTTFMIIRDMSNDWLFYITTSMIIGEQAIMGFSV